MTVGTATSGNAFNRRSVSLTPPNADPLHPANADPVRRLSAAVLVTFTLLFSSSFKHTVRQIYPQSGQQLPVMLLPQARAH